MVQVWRSGDSSDHLAPPAQWLSALLGGGRIGPLDNEGAGAGRGCAHAQATALGVEHQSILAPFLNRQGGQETIGQLRYSTLQAPW